MTPPMRANTTASELRLWGKSKNATSITTTATPAPEVIPTRLGELE